MEIVPTLGPKIKIRGFMGQWGGYPQPTLGTSLVIYIYIYWLLYLCLSNIDKLICNSLIYVQYL